MNLLYNYHMKMVIIILGYLKWHYGKAIYSISRIWKNFLFFVFEFFSIKLLFRNFSDPWKKMSDSYPKNFNLKEYFYAFITNIIVRIVGMIMRTGLIITGLASYLIMVLLYPIIIIGWLFLPLIIIILIGNGLFLFFS
jgi:hypothetical protein